MLESFARQDMDPILALLGTHDFVSYQEKGQQEVAKGFKFRVCRVYFTLLIIEGFVIMSVVINAGSVSEKLYKGMKPAVVPVFQALYTRSRDLSSASPRKAYNLGGPPTL